MNSRIANVYNISLNLASLTNPFFIDCMESILHYKRILIKKHHLADPTLVEDCFRLLASLRGLDPARRNRYDDLGQ